MENSKFKIERHVIKNSEPVAEHHLDDDTRDFLNNAEIDFYNQAKHLTCDTCNHTEHKVTLHLNEDDLSIHVLTCCENFVKKIHDFFEGYQHPVWGVCLE